MCSRFCQGVGKFGCALVPAVGQWHDGHWHRCPGTSTVAGGLADRATVRTDKLREIETLEEATCAWLAFCSGDGLEVADLFAKSLCDHAWREMWKLANFVCARSPGMTPDALRDELAEHDETLETRILRCEMFGSLGEFDVQP